MHKFINKQKNYNNTVKSIYIYNTICNKIFLKKIKNSVIKNILYY